MAEKNDDDFIYGRLQNELKEIEEQKKRAHLRKRESESNWLADLLRQIGKALAYSFELLAKLFEKFF
ncbi:MAG: hypothetical protein VR77_08845 [Flavobacteriales bacterium BRH_c54]|nr:MAG: hypothetical protein VR77_08845 [Flavobacteriales bacterium BRH_c54]